MRKIINLLTVLIVSVFAVCVHANKQIPSSEPQSSYSYNRQQPDSVFTQCSTSSFSDNQITTVDMYRASQKYDECIKKRLYEENRLLFAPQYEEKIQTEQDTVVNAITDYYHSLYSENKFCVCSYNPNRMCPGTISILDTANSKSTALENLLIDTTTIRDFLDKKN